MTHMAEGEGVILSASLWRMAYKNRYVTRPLKKIDNQEIHTIRIIFHKDNFSHIK